MGECRRSLHHQAPRSVHTTGGQNLLIMVHQRLQSSDLLLDLAIV